MAEAALADTLDAVARCAAQRRLIALDGAPGPWLPPDFKVFPQQGCGLDERLAAAWDYAGGPGLQIGMDTPQVTPDLLDLCLGRLDSHGTTAALGAASDGGWWAIGLRRAQRGVFVGVPMSTAHTGRDQQRRLLQLGHEVVALPTLRDVDYMGDADAVADLIPASRFAQAHRRCLAPPW